MFTINNIVNLCQPPRLPLFAKKKEWIPLAGDALILAAVAILIALTVHGGHADLLGTASLDNPVIYGSMIAGGSLILGDSVTSIFRRIFQSERRWIVVSDPSTDASPYIKAEPQYGPYPALLSPIPDTSHPPIDSAPHLKPEPAPYSYVPLMREPAPPPCT